MNSFGLNKARRPLFFSIFEMNFSAILIAFSFKPDSSVPSRKESVFSLTAFMVLSIAGLVAQPLSVTFKVDITDYINKIQFQLDVYVKAQKLKVLA